MSLCLDSLGIQEWCREIVCRNSDMWRKYTPVVGDGIGVQGGRGVLACLEACSISESVFAEIKLLASSVVALPAVLLRLMQNPSQPSAIAEYNLAACSINGSSQPVTRDQYPKIHWRPKYSYTHCIPFNTYSFSLQMQHLGGSCWVHFLKRGKIYFQTGFSPACSFCPE